MPILTVDCAMPGIGNTILFVGSNTAPNADGLKWFAEQVLPIISGSLLDVQVVAVGSVRRAFPSGLHGVKLLGFVENLDILYRDTAVVISPLRMGSGLKIKLVDAFGFGKAVVATTISLQGIESITKSAVAVADSATGFAAAVVSFLTDIEKRKEMGNRVLEIAKEHFSTSSCFDELVEYLITPKSNDLY